MALFSQEYRHITIDTPLGKDVLLVSQVNGTEGVSQLFSFELSLLSENQGITFSDIVGKPVTIAISLPTGARKYLNGIVSRFAQETGSGTTTGDTRVSSYRATVVPWLWLLTRSAESRIFQNMTVPEIVEKVFKDRGFDSFELKLQGNYSKRDYCVQYRETHFNFVSRLMEEEGIFYFFEHGDGKHKLILADSSRSFLPCPEQASASYQIEPSTTEDFITSIEKIQEIRSSKYVLNDFNFETPTLSLMADVPAREKLWQSDLEIYDFPGGYLKRKEGNDLAQIRMEEEEAHITRILGESGCRAFASGFRFTLNNAFRSDMNGKSFVLTGLELRVSNEPRSGGLFAYSNRFICIPDDVPYRPPRVTPKPTVQGSQTAVVVGPPGEEVYPDALGQVKVQFYWDREGKKNENSSCWIRVNQPWAGLNWGAMFIPRIGQEVIVDFLEGDPDRPIITGRVYNGINKPPYPLPAEKTKSTVKTSSTPGGDGFNEIRFEDKKGAEQLFLHAERQMDLRVKADSLESVGHDRHLTVENDQLEKVDGDKHLTVKGNLNEKVDGTVSLITGSDLQQKTGIKYCHEAGQEIHLKAGMKVVIEAGMQLTIKGPGGFVDIGPAGVTIQGTMVMINSGGAAGSGSGVSTESPKEPKGAASARPGGVSSAGSTQDPGSPAGPSATALKKAAESGAPFCCPCCP